MLAFCWIVDFPMFERNPETGEWDFSHNPFSMPQGGLEALESQDPGEILAFQYDVVCNGVELSSGAVRNHLPEVMEKAFAIAGYSRDRIERSFPALWNAFHYGPPPHAGIAPGSTGSSCSSRTSPTSGRSSPSRSTRRPATCSWGRRHRSRRHS